MANFIKKIKSVIVGLTVVAGCIGIVPVCDAYGAETCDVIGHYSTEESLFFYVNGLSGEVEDAFCKVDDSTGVLRSVSGTEEEILHTLVLWDAVTPYDEVMQDYMKEVIGELIANRSENEVFTIAQAGERLVYSIEDSAEYAELMTVVNELGNGEEKGALLPVVYEAVKDLVKSERDGVNRIIIVTDGGKEDADSEVTDKLAVLLERMAYPVYILAWPENIPEDDGTEGKSGADVCTVLEAAGAERMDWTLDMSSLQMAAMFSEEYRAMKIETQIPAGDRDGSKRKVVLSVVTTEGVFEDECTMDVPAGLEEKEQEAAFPFMKYKKWFLWGGIGVASVLLLVSVIALVKKKKRYRIAKMNYDRDAEAATVSRQHSGTEEDTTVMHKIKLTNRADEMNSYQSGFKGAVIIGRNPNSCTLLINGDNSLSARHCGIYVRRGHFFIRDLNSSNGTKVNGIPLADEIEIRTGDVVKLGRAEYLIRLE